MPLVATRGAASAQGFGEFAQPAAPALYIEDVFSTYLYTGTGSAITINNGVDLSGKGGLVWNKVRTGTTTGEHYLIDTVRGSNKLLSTSSVAAEDTSSTAITAFNADGFSLGTNGIVNTNTRTYCTWTFREQAKFFDVVTYTGNGDADRNIAHNLGSVPGMIVIKKTSGTGNWATAASLSSTAYAIGGGGAGSGFEFSLNSSDQYYDNPLKSTIATDTTVNVPRVYYNDATVCNASGATYVMYLFASNAGGFGAAGTDNVISCGSFTTNSSGGYSVNLGYEAQYVLIKRVSGTGNWLILDVMRGAAVSANTSRVLKADLVAAEATDSVLMSPNATGFGADSSLSNLTGSSTFIYMAIRRGPMKTPTSGTSVFSPITSSDTTGTTQTTGFPIDLQIAKYRATTYSAVWSDRLRGVITTPTNATAPTLESANTDAEKTTITATRYWDNTGFQTPTGWSGNSVAFWSFRRAPGFFDQVCWTGNASTNQTVNHNLGAIPELIITKSRGNVTSWLTYAATEGVNKYALLNSSAGFGSITVWPAAPTSTTFNIDMTQYGAAQSSTMVAYLFATVAGVSKVGSYAGTGGTQTINCGFTSGARFVLIKRTDSTGDWWVWDTARGMVAGTDPRIPFNLTDSETNNNWVYTESTGFQIVTTDASVNASGGTYIFLAIA